MKPREFSIQPMGIHLASWTFISTPCAREDDFNGIHPKIIHLREIVAQPKPADLFPPVMARDFLDLTEKLSLCERERDVLNKQLKHFKEEMPAIKGMDKLLWEAVEDLDQAKKFVRFGGSEVQAIKRIESAVGDIVRVINTIKRNK